MTKTEALRLALEAFGSNRRTIITARTHGTHALSMKMDAPMILRVTSATVGLMKPMLELTKPSPPLKPH